MVSHGARLKLNSGWYTRGIRNRELHGGHSPINGLVILTLRNPKPQYRSVRTLRIRDAALSMDPHYTWTEATSKILISLEKWMNLKKIAKKMKFGMSKMRIDVADIKFTLHV